MDKIIVELVGIQTISCSHEFNKGQESLPLYSGILDFDFELKHHLQSGINHFLSIIVTTKITNSATAATLFTLITQSNFALKCEKHLLDVPLSADMLNYLVHFSYLALAHNHGILSGATLNTPLFNQSTYPTQSAKEMKEIVREKMNTRGN